MKRFSAVAIFIASAAVAMNAEQLIPAGSVMQCIVSEGNISSKTTHIGDPVLCQVNRTELYGRSVFPYGSYLMGHFEDYRDPGHFVGKGWMELKFDRMVVGNDTVIPISTRVVANSGKNPVDKDGKILGTGHAVKDTVEWMIPVLWPIDLINLPRRGPTPVLKAETRLTVKILDDIGIPTKSEVQHQPELISRFNYSDPTPTQQQAAPIERNYTQPQQYPQQVPVQQSYVPQQYPQPNPTVVVVQAQAPTIVQQQAPAQQSRPRVVYTPNPYGYGYPPLPYGYYYRPY